MTSNDPDRDARRRETRWLRPVFCTVAGMAGNIALTVLKIVVGLLAGSASLIADGVHSFSDLAGDVGVFVALKASAIPPDRDHPYGHQHYETLGALGVSLLLLVTGVLLGRQAIGNIVTGTGSHPEFPALIAAGVSIVAKEGMARYTDLAGRIHHSPALRSNAAHHRSDALSSVGAAIGIGGAMAGLPILDSVAAAVISLLILKMGWELLRNNAMIVLETMPDEEFVSEVRATAATVPGVISVSRLRIRPRGSVYTVDISITVEPDITVEEGHAIADRLEQALENSATELYEAVAHVEPHPTVPGRRRRRAPEAS